MKMNHMKWIAVVLVIGFMAAIPAMAGEKMVSEHSSITGTVEKTDQGIVIAADDGTTYMVQGKNLTDMVGKTVLATGTLAESESGKTFNVISVEVTQE